MAAYKGDMKMKKLLIVAALVASTASGLSMAQKPQKQAAKPVVIVDIEIKGLKVGMEHKDFMQAMSESDAAGGFTIGGVLLTNYKKQPYVEFVDDKVATLYFKFDSANFDAVFDAVKSKYPSIRCERSEIQNRMGASFQQIECQLSSINGLMTLSRYSGSISDGSIYMASRSRLDSSAKESEKKKSDI